MSTVGRFDDRVAFCTGGGSGISRAFAWRMASEGARVLLAERDVDAGTATEAALRAAGHDAVFVPTDVTDLASVEQAVAVAMQRWGRIDVLLNAAGGSLPGDAPITEVDLSIWDPTFDANVKGTAHCCRAVIPVMAEHGGGSVINLTSLFALRGNHTRHVYGAAKGAVIALTRELAARHARDGVRVNVVVPGTVLTERVKAQFDANTDEHGHNAAAAAMGFDDHPASVHTPEELAGVLAFLASDDARIVTGALVPADGGMLAW